MASSPGLENSVLGKGFNATLSWEHLLPSLGDGPSLRTEFPYAPFPGYDIVSLPQPRGAYAGKAGNSQPAR